MLEKVPAPATAKWQRLSLEGENRSVCWVGWPVAAVHGECHCCITLEMTTIYDVAHKGWFIFTQFRDTRGV